MFTLYISTTRCLHPPAFMFSSLVLKFRKGFVKYPPGKNLIITSTYWLSGRGGDDPICHLPTWWLINEISLLGLEILITVNTTSWPRLAIFTFIFSFIFGFKVTGTLYLKYQFKKCYYYESNTSGSHNNREHSSLVLQAAHSRQSWKPEYFPS